MLQSTQIDYPGQVTRAFDSLKEGMSILKPTTVKCMEVDNLAATGSPCPPRSK